MIVRLFVLCAGVALAAVAGFLTVTAFTPKAEAPTWPSTPITVTPEPSPLPSPAGH